MFHLSQNHFYRKIPLTPSSQNVAITRLPNSDGSKTVTKPSSSATRDWSAATAATCSATTAIEDFEHHEHSAMPDGDRTHFRDSLSNYRT
jgi:hypothetical protein